MKKLSLDLDALTVDTFETAATGAAAGTVVGHAKTDRDTCAATCIQNTCLADCSEPTVNEWTCWDTCGACPFSQEPTCIC